MRNLRPLVFLVITMSSASVWAGACPPSAHGNTQPSFDASLLKEGRFIYRTTLGGEFLGETALEIRRKGDTWRITMSAPKIEQSWEAEVRRSFAPLSAHLKMKTRHGPYEMSLTYSGREVKGEERKADTVKPVSAALNGVVLDQRVDWAAVMALQAPAGSLVEMSVFDPAGLSRMLGEVGGARPLTGPFGEVQSVSLGYRICKPDHVESYLVHATRDLPRYMLREDMPNGLVSELTRIEP